MMDINEVFKDIKTVESIKLTKKKQKRTFIGKIINNIINFFTKSQSFVELVHIMIQTMQYLNATDMTQSFQQIPFKGKFYDVQVVIEEVVKSDD